jgi:hypothetical protein
MARKRGVIEPSGTVHFLGKTMAPPSLIRQ